MPQWSSSFSTGAAIRGLSTGTYLAGTAIPGSCKKRFSNHMEFFVHNSGFWLPIHIRQAWRHLISIMQAFALQWDSVCRYGADTSVYFLQSIN